MCSCDYQWYRKLVKGYLQKDNREINYQNRIIIPFLESLFSSQDNISVVDVSTQYKNRNTKLHDRDIYANVSTPDLLIAQNWNYNNKEYDDIKYLATVEIKIPYAKDKRQIEQYLKTSIHKVIWTNCMQWEFYDDKKSQASTIYLEENGDLPEQTAKWDCLIECIMSFLGLDYGVKNNT